MKLPRDLSGEEVCRALNGWVLNSFARPVHIAIM